MDNNDNQEIDDKIVETDEAKEIELYDEPEHEKNEPKHHDVEEPFDENAAEEPAPRKQEKRPRANKRINELQREKYQALMELDHVKSENEKLKRIADLSNKTALFNYEENVKQRLDQAKNQMAQAIESGDIQAQTNAQLDLSMAATEYKQAKDWKVQKEYEDSQHQQNLQYQQQEQQQGIPIEAQNWAVRNTWLNSNSEDYDEELATIVDSAVDKMDAYLYRNGLGNKVYSREYFQEIDNYVNSLRNQREEQIPSNNQYAEDDSDDYQPNVRRQIPMRQTKQSVAPVRSRNMESGRNKEILSISSEQREMASLLGVSPKLYALEKNRLEKLGKQSLNRGGR